MRRDFDLTSIIRTVLCCTETSVLLHEPLACTNNRPCPHFLSLTSKKHNAAEDYFITAMQVLPTARQNTAQLVRSAVGSIESATDITSLSTVSRMKEPSSGSAAVRTVECGRDEVPEAPLPARGDPLEAKRSSSAQASTPTLPPGACFHSASFFQHT